LLDPQEQVRGYVEYLGYFNRCLGEHPGSLAGCAFLHNATSGSIAGLRHPDVADLAFFPAFAADEVAAFRAFLTSRLAPAPGAQFADDFLHAQIAPSKQLLKLVPEEIKANPQFTLLDQQQVAFQVVLRAVEHAKRADAKEAVIITGGPGTGKSVIAVALLGELAKRGLNISHATGSKSFTKTLQKVVSRRVRGMRYLFRYTSEFTVAERNGMDVLIVDEAHRIRLVTSYPFMRPEKRWQWSKPRPDGTLVDDVVIGPWTRPWNLNADTALNGVPPSDLWATDSGGFGQVGCIYTAQGFEYDYGGVIMGADLVWREDHWEPSAAASRDNRVRRADNFDILTRNTYKVLLTRGLLGCVIYSIDEETRHMLAGLAIPELQATTHE
jgi:Uncharacterized conserved protein (DUF2075)